MLSYEYILAFTLLTTPLDPADLGPDLDAVMPTFLRLAIEAEILDPREDQYLEGLSQDPAGDVRVLQKRYRHLVKAPRLAEGDRFPERKLLDELLAFNRAYRKDLAGCQPVDAQSAERLRTAINEVDQLYFVWSLLRDVRCHYYYVTARRDSLMQLRDLVGPAAFYSAQLPPHIPYWHFPRLK